MHKQYIRTLQVHVLIFISRQNHTDTVLVVRSVSLIALLIELITIVAVVLSQFCYSVSSKTTVYFSVEQCVSTALVQTVPSVLKILLKLHIGCVL